MRPRHGPHEAALAAGSPKPRATSHLPVETLHLTKTTGLHDTPAPLEPKRSPSPAHCGRIAANTARSGLGPECRRPAQDDALSICFGQRALGQQMDIVAHPACISPGLATKPQGRSPLRLKPFHSRRRVGADYLRRCLNLSHSRQRRTPAGNDTGTPPQISHLIWTTRLPYSQRAHRLRVSISTACMAPALAPRQRAAEVTLSSGHYRPAAAPYQWRRRIHFAPPTSAAPWRDRRHCALKKPHRRTRGSTGVTGNIH